MGLVSTWLSGIGLSHAIPSFQAAGITTPGALAELDLQHYEALGVTEANDRRKLFYLVQRIKMAKHTKDDEDDEDATTSNHDQQEVDDVLAKTGGTTVQARKQRKLILHEDDPLEDDDEEESETRSTRRTSQRISSAKPEKGAASAKENHRRVRKPSSKAAPDSRQRTCRISRSNAVESRRKSSRKVEEDDDDDEQNVSPEDNDDSDFGSSDMSEADEAPQPKTDQPRSSSRLREKRQRRSSRVFAQSGAWQQDEEDEESSIASSSSRRSTRSRKSAGSVPQQKVPSAKRQSSSRADLSDDSDSAGPRVRSSAMPKPRTRRYESRIQNPGASARTGKQLSAIPADSIAPMSPLVALPASKMNADIRRQMEKEEKRAAIKARAASGRLTRQRSGSIGSQSGSESESAGRRGRTLSGSDSESSAPRGSSHRKSLEGISSRKTATSSSKSRRSSLGGGRPDMSSVQKPHSLRDLRQPQSDLEERIGRHSLPSSSKTAESSKGAVFVHGIPEDTSWATQVARLREDNDSEHELFAGHCVQTRDDDAMRIRVIVRKRPMSSGESASEKEVDIVHPLEHDTYGRILVYQPKTRVDLTKEIETVAFAYDSVFGETSSNLQIYERSVRSLIPGIFEGKYCSVFAYGATGAGKTFTMMGSNLTGINAGSNTNDEKNLGLYYMAALDVFELANEPDNRHLSVGASLFEIYSGKLFDLLNERKPVKCLENHRGKVCFPGLSEHPVSSAAELMDVIEAGVRNRSTGTTSKNADSSRSHAVLQLSLRKDVGRQKNVEHGRLTFIDLAGSERGADTSQASRTTRLEGAEINTSLLALKEVIRALATGDSMAHIPFRGSKLTQVLKESFVGKNARSVMIACIAPNIGNCEHTLNTLRYADRVKERDSETGRLPAGEVGDRARATNRRYSRSSSAPVRSSSAGRASALGANDDDEDIFDKDNEVASLNEISAQEDNDLAGSEQSADSELLDDLLDSDALISAQASKDDSEVLMPSPNGTNGTGPTGRKLAAEALVSEHRAIMTEMLEMVKHEMTLVNKADGNRDTIDVYMDELDSIHQKQLSLISTLRERLTEYNASGGQQKMQSSWKTPVDMGILSDDDSFEDLRD